MAPGKMQVAVPVFPEVKLMAFIDAKANPYLFACQCRFCRYCSYLIVSFHIRYMGIDHIINSEWLYVMRLPIFFMVVSLGLGQFNVCLSSNDMPLNNKDNNDLS